MQATLRCPSGASIDLDLDESSQALKLTLDAEGKRMSVLLPEKSAHSLRALIFTMLEAGVPWRRM